MFHEFRDKFGDPIDFIFARKYSVSVQIIRVYKINNSTNFDVKEALDFLNILQEKFDYSKDWTPFFLSVVKIEGDNYLYKFVSKSLKEKEMHKHFCQPAISQIIKMKTFIALQMNIFKNM